MIVLASQPKHPHLLSGFFPTCEIFGIPVSNIWHFNTLGDSLTKISTQNCSKKTQEHTGVNSLQNFKTIQGNTYCLKAAFRINIHWTRLIVILLHPRGRILTPLKSPHRSNKPTTHNTPHSPETPDTKNGGAGESRTRGDFTLLHVKSTAVDLIRKYLDNAREWFFSDNLDQKNPRSNSSPSGSNAETWTYSSGGWPTGCISSAGSHCGVAKVCGYGLVWSQHVSEQFRRRPLLYRSEFWFALSLNASLGRRKPKLE